jgi:hypothetical protein
VSHSVHEWEESDLTRLLQQRVDKKHAWILLKKRNNNRLFIYTGMDKPALAEKLGIPIRIIAGPTNGIVQINFFDLTSSMNMDLEALTEMAKKDRTEAPMPSAAWSRG